MRELSVVLRAGYQDSSYGLDGQGANVADDESNPEEHGPNEEETAFNLLDATSVTKISLGCPVNALTFYRTECSPWQR